MRILEEQIYQWFLKRVGRTKSGKVLANKIIVKLCEDIKCNPLDARKAMEGLKKSSKLEYASSANGEPVSSFISVTRPIETVSRHTEMWCDVLNNSNISEQDKLALEPLSSHLEGFSSDDMNAILSGLQELRNVQDQHRGEYIFAVSAKYLLGSSKLLSKFENRRLKLFGIDVELFSDRPPYVIAGGNTKNPDAVILVENPISFEVAVQSEAAKRCAFICTFGFGLSNQSNEFGYQLLGAIETDKTIVLRRTEGECIDFPSLLNHKNCHFWGDLDAAGMHIFTRMKKKLPHLRLSALYFPMICALKTKHANHPYVTATGKTGQIPFLTGDSVACAIGILCLERSVCQEFVRASDIEEYAGIALTIENMPIY
jgi:hypothetical protein